MSEVPYTLYDEDSRFPGDDGKRPLYVEMRESIGPESMDFRNGKQQVINAALVQDGMSVEQVVAKFHVQPKITVASIVQHNLRCFQEVMDDSLKPYRRIWEALNAMKTERITVREKVERFVNGRTIEVTVLQTKYVEVPDHAERRAAAKQWATMCGLDPNIAKSIRITQGSTTIDIGAIYMEIMEAGNEDMDAAYNRAVAAERKGGGIMLPAAPIESRPVD